MSDHHPKGFSGGTAGESGGVVLAFPGRGARRSAAACLCDGGDGCRQAVTRTYRELRERGVSDRFAFEAGLRLYGLRHPEVPRAAARDCVAGWISHALGQ